MARRYIGGSKARSSDVFNIRLPEEDINPLLLIDPKYSDKLLKEEYTRLRDIAQKRIKRMGKSWEEAEETLNWLDRGTFVGFPTLKMIKESYPDPRKMREKVVYELQFMKKFLTAKRGSISGIRAVNKQISETLKQNRIYVSESDLKKFGTFMNTMKRAYRLRGHGFGSRDYASDQFAQLWSTLNEKGNITQEEYAKALKETLARIEEEKTGTPIKKVRRREETFASSFFSSEKLSARTRKAHNRRKGKRK